MSNKFVKLRHQAPEDLRTELKTLVASSEAKKVTISFHFGNWFGAALGSAAVLCLILWASFNQAPRANDLLQQEVVNSHIRSMMSDHLFDVASTDSHSVKPWFSGKIDFSPRLVDLRDAGFPIVGGRLDYIANRAVAAVVYMHDQHFINVFIWPTNEDTYPPVFAASKGFNIWRWQSDGMVYFAVSDLNKTTLRDFVDLMNTARK